MNKENASQRKAENSALTWQNLLPTLSQTLIFLREIPDVLKLLQNSVAPVIGFDQINLILPNSQTNQPCLSYVSQKTNDVETLDPNQFSNMPAALIFSTQKMLLCDGETFRKSYRHGADLPPYKGLEDYCLLPLTTSRQFLGGIEFIKRYVEEIDDDDLQQLRKLAVIVAATLENILERSALQALEEHSRRKSEHYRVLVNVTNATLSKLTMNDLVDEIANSIHSYFGFDYVSVDTCDFNTHKLRTHSVHYKENGSRMRNSVEMSIYASLSGQVMLNREKALLDRQQIESLSGKYSQVAILANQGFQMILALPLIAGDHARGALKLGHYKPYIFSDEKSVLIEQIAARLAIVLDNALAYEEISSLKDKLATENRYLSEEISNYAGFDEIIGNSLAMQAVLRQVEMVAPSDATVLILGETGTGKELIARAIHRLSGRNRNTMVKMNCAAVPTGLLESDLFGHEKGAFTGAHTQRQGRFELANESTLFLDEVGDIPLELQPKLLRVLQEREIERLGGTRTIPVDVRVIAATNIDLRQKVADHEYRSDLYYRLNVFPIVIPPLRERTEDIPQLVKFFVQKYAHRLKKHIDSIPSELIARLIQMPWPGNVRELENVIERAVILSRGNVLELPINELQYMPADASDLLNVKSPAPEPAVTVPIEPMMRELPQTDKETIMRVLRETNGTVSGPRGAAALLGMKRTTLLSRMQKLGITAKNFKTDDWVVTQGRKGWMHQ